MTCFRVALLVGFHWVSVCSMFSAIGINRRPDIQRGKSFNCETVNVHISPRELSFQFKKRLFSFRTGKRSRFVKVAIEADQYLYL
jgi:hypothetical protein